MLIAIGAVLTFLAGICGLVMAYFAIVSLKNKDFPTFLISAVFFAINALSVVGFIYDVLLVK